ncbi:hypothetical protein ASZ90_003067 [hydrocarbon metagenome]|uniref:Uncharacterized protein n=1 Tax=hydrocarbon metagenome TaxID=938273 RepID=A0A0W8G1Q1_9ZZZZ
MYGHHFSPFPRSRVRNCQPGNAVFLKIKEILRKSPREGKRKRESSVRSASP